MGYWTWQGRIEGQGLTLRLSAGGLVVAADPLLVVAADLEGRPWRIIDGPDTFRWGLNGRALAVRRDREGRRVRNWLEIDEASALWESTRGRLAPLLRRAVEGEVGALTYTAGGSESPPGHIERERVELGETLRRMAGWDEAALRHDAARFAAVYTPVGILPPDQYMALVIQLTTGCSFNTCTFCTFYRDIPFRIRDPHELATHMEEVDAFLGRGVHLRRTVFLGDANALVVPTPKLVELVQAVGDRYPTRSLHAFLDGFSGTKKTAEDFARLRELGLSRVSIGLESGHDPLLAWLRKPGEAGDAADAVCRMKEAGLQVSVIVLLGAGGTRFADVHAEDTAALLAALPLDDDDLVYFSEFVDQPDAPYGTVAREEEVEALDEEGMGRQRERIATALRQHARGGPRTAIYDIREFTY